MTEGLDQILRHLQNPDISSSALPLLVVMLLFFFGSLFALIKIFSGLRFKLPEKPEPLSMKDTPALKFLKGGKWRQYFRFPVKEAAKAPSAPASELDQLRRLVQKLEQANAVERELHAKALRKISELQGELQRLFLQRGEEQKLLEFERGRRIRLEDKASQLEAQLQGAIHETERIFERSAKQAFDSTGQLTGDEEMIALPDPEVEKKRQASTPATINNILADFPPNAGEAAGASTEIIAKQAAEIEKLKTILRDIREKMSTPTRKAG